MAHRRRRRQTRALRPNIRATKHGIQVYTEVGGKFLSQRFRYTKTLTTPEQLLEAYDEEIRAWLATYRDTPPEKNDAADPGTLEADVARYLKARAAMPSLVERKRQLQAWLAALGPHKRTRSITPLEIQTQRDRWLTVGPRLVQQKGKPKGERWKLIDKPLSPTAVNHRLRALSNLFRVLYPNFPNPMRTVDEAREQDAVPRAISYDALAKILAAMPDRSRRKKGQRYKAAPGHSLSKARVEVLMWTGMTPTELQRVSREDIDLERKQLTIPPRRKGEGAPGRIIPLAHVPEGLRALKRLIALGGLGDYDDGVVRRAFQRAARAAGYVGVTLYTIRHAFVTQVLSATKDFRQAQLLAGHTDPRTTQRYALAAVLPTLELGMKAMRTAALTPKRDRRRDRLRPISGL